MLYLFFIQKHCFQEEVIERRNIANGTRGKGLNTKLVGQNDVGSWGDHNEPSLKDSGSSKEESLDCGACSSLVNEGQRRIVFQYMCYMVTYSL